MIFVVVGTHGAGKSTLVRQVVESYGWHHEVRDESKMPVRMRCYTHDIKPLEVIGYYFGQIASGPDSGRFSGRLPEIYQWVRDAHAAGFNVLMEGINLMGARKRLFDLARDFPVAIMHVDESLLLCVDSVITRKAARPGHRHAKTPVNTGTIRAKAKAAEQLVRDAPDYGAMIFSGDRAAVLSQLLKLLKLDDGGGTGG
jgi:hypothetical protein